MSDPIKLQVDLFDSRSGKWKYGGVVEVSGKYHLWEDEYMQELIDNQKFVVAGTFQYYTVVVTHTEEFNASNRPGFYTQLYPVGRFTAFVETPKAA